MGDMSPEPAHLKTTSIASFTFPPSLSRYNVSFPGYLSANPTITALIVSAVVFRRASSADLATASPTPGQNGDTHAPAPAPAPEQPQTRVLVIQRAASDYLPNRWEIPGGSCDDTDATVLHALARELWEESGLRMAAVRALVDDEAEFDDEFKPEARWRKLTFWVDLDEDSSRASTRVVLDPEEHQAYAWATEDEVRRGRCGEAEIGYSHRGQMDLVLKGFSMMKAAESHS